MAVNPYRPIRGSTVVFKIVINSPVADFARISVKKTDGTVVMPEVDMTLSAPGVYTYSFQTTVNMPLTTYNGFAAVGLNGRTVRDKQSFVLVAN
jgi:hypothetical protein